MQLHLSRQAVGLAALACLALGSLSACAAAPEPSESSSAAPQVEGNQRAYDYSVELAACLTEKGWDVEVDGAGGWGIIWHVPVEQSELIAADDAACAAEIGTDIFDVSEENLEYAYDNNTRVVDCLEARGYDTAAPPSRESFVSKSLDDPDAIVWEPYELVPEGDMSDAVTSCPQ